MKRLLVASLLVLFGFAGMAYAAETHEHHGHEGHHGAHDHHSDEECSKLGITIINNTDRNCSLVAQSLIHGYYFSSRSDVPRSIPKQSKAEPFFLEVSLLGAEIQLTYNCEGETISFDTIQEPPVFAEGEIRGRTTYSKALPLQYNAIEGRCHPAPQHGSIVWTIG